MTAELSEAGLVRLSFNSYNARNQQPPQTSDSSASPLPIVPMLIERLQAYVSGQRVNFDDIPLDSDGLTAFRRAVTESCRRVAYGEVISYQELARRAGHPDAARAVGQVMANNRWPIIVPCHRIIASGGRLGGYSAPDGLALKKRLLALEQGAAVSFAYRPEV
ncbi:MAG: methylated-DNA--[protein]-cysteine S-methyltransferase [Pirellulales bacterium]